MRGAGVFLGNPVYVDFFFLLLFFYETTNACFIHGDAQMRKCSLENPVCVFFNEITKAFFMHKDARVFIGNPCGLLLFLFHEIVRRCPFWGEAAGGARVRLRERVPLVCGEG